MNCTHQSNVDRSHGEIEFAGNGNMTCAHKAFKNARPHRSAQRPQVQPSRPMYYSACIGDITPDFKISNNSATQRVRLSSERLNATERFIQLTTTLAPSITKAD